MENYIIMCRSVTYAQRSQRLLEKAGISSYITKAPQGVTPEGCSYGVKVSRRNVWRATELLRGAGIKLGKLYRVGQDGEVWEAEL